MVLVLKAQLNGDPSDLRITGNEKGITLQVRDPTILAILGTLTLDWLTADRLSLWIERERGRNAVGPLEGEEGVKKTPSIRLSAPLPPAR
jgi:hypothetical protein